MMSVGAFGPVTTWRLAGRPVRLLAVLLLSMFVTAGCTTGFVYQRLDWLVAWYVSDYVTLDDAQEARLRNSIRNAMTWHRQTQIPRYRSWLAGLSAEASAPLTRDQVRGRYEEIVAMLDDALDYIVPATADAFRGLSDSQIEELRANLAEDNAELWSEFAGDTRAERRERQVESAERVLKRLVGRLTPEQRSLVERQLGGMQDLSVEWMDRREHWQRRLVELLDDPPPGAAFPAALHDLMLRPDQFDDGTYRRRVEENREVIFGMVAAVTAGLTPAQRQHLKERLGEFSRDLGKLAQSG